MRKGTLYLEGIPGSPYSPSRKHDEPMKDREDWEAYDERTWMLHNTVNSDGQIVIPQMGLKQCLDAAAAKVGQKVKGRGTATYKNFFASGLLVEADIPLSNGKAVLTPADAVMVKINAHANGQRGSGKRVIRRFPVYHNWHAVAEIIVVDDLLTSEIVDQHVKIGGLLIGLGRFRPQNGGVNGRFRLVKSEWKDVDVLS